MGPAPQHRTYYVAKSNVHHRYCSCSGGRNYFQTQVDKVKDNEPPLDKRIVVSAKSNQRSIGASVEKPGTRKATPQVCKFKQQCLQTLMTRIWENRQQSLHNLWKMFMQMEVLIKVVVLRCTLKELCKGSRSHSHPKDCLFSG